MNILTFSTLYPNAAMPNHGLFVEQRTQQLSEEPGIAVKVVAPVPWFPSKNPSFGSYSYFARSPRNEIRGGIEVSHPRYLVIPKVGMTLAPLLLAMGAYSTVIKLARAGFEFDVIDAHYFYPDGVAAALLAKILKKPYIITARGSDINLIPRYMAPRAMIRKAAAGAAHIVTVSEALKLAIEDLGIASGKISALRNGVNLDLFQPGDKQTACEQLQVHSPMILSVGNLVDLKGHHLVIESMKDLPGIHLSIIGEGPMKSALAEQIHQLGLTDRVRLVGAIPQPELRTWYSAADALVLASEREGMPNVLLESLACGTPVIATKAGGTPEVVSGEAAGLLVDRDPQSIANGVLRLLDTLRAPSLVRNHAERFSWKPVISKLRAIMEEIATR